jgi:PAS domain S-box-containing protein
MSKLGQIKRANVLLVDDSEENLFLLQSSLKSMNINTILACSGAEALEKQKGKEIAVAIIDVLMPLMNGFELASRLNSRRRKARIPIIFLTASQNHEQRIYKGYSVGAVDYLIKPFDLKILRFKISTLIELHYDRQIVTESANQLRKTTKKVLNINLKLKISEEKFRSYIDHSPDGVFITDQFGRYLEVNKAACRITGYSKRAILQMTIRDFLVDESLAEGLLQFSKLQTAGKSTSDIQFRHKNGTLRWWTVDAVKLSETRYLGFAKDITIRKNALLSLAEREEQYRSLFNSILKV